MIISNLYLAKRNIIPDRKAAIRGFPIIPVVITLGTRLGSFETNHAATRHLKKLYLYVLLIRLSVRYMILQYYLHPAHTNSRRNQLLSQRYEFGSVLRA